MTTAQAARNIKQGIADDIRRVAPAHCRITLDTALANWAYFFNDGRYTQARIWWQTAHELMLEGSK